MYLQEMVEVAIGLIFAWLLLSIAVLQIQEIIARLSHKRSKELYKAIEGMLSDKKTMEAFYEHPLIQSLKSPPQGVRDWFSKMILKKDISPHNPSYIPAETFATALFDVITKAGTEQSLIIKTYSEIRTTINDLEAGDQNKANELISHLVDLGRVHAGTTVDKLKSNLRKEMLKKLTELEQVGSTDQEKPLAKFSNEVMSYVYGDKADELAIVLKSAEPYLEQIRKGAVLSGGKQLGRALNSLLAGAEDFATGTDKAISLARKNVETWFDATMDRLTGWYKRWAQVWAFVIALGIAIAFNVDSIHIARELWRDPALRQASNTYIENFVDNKTSDGSALSEEDLQVINVDLQKLDFPIGWSELPETAQPFWPFWVLKIIGWLTTAGAAMQGAPFWFDTLKKVVNIRSAGANPAEKPKESTSDKER